MYVTGVVVPDFVAVITFQMPLAGRSQVLKRGLTVMGTYVVVEPVVIASDE